MVFIFQNSRLGNKIFQYMAIKKYSSTSTIIVFGFDGMLSLFDIDIFNISRPNQRNKESAKEIKSVHIVLWMMLINFLATLHKISINFK